MGKTARIGRGIASTALAIAFLPWARAETPRDDTRPGPVVIAHRGASGLAPEHTRPAYDLAIEQGADYIEQDVRMTRDGVLVVLHDDTLNRTARGPAEHCSGPVRTRTLAELEHCDFGRWFEEKRGSTTGRFADQRLVTLDALLAHYGHRVRYYIETKQSETAPGMEEALLALLRKHDLLPRRAGDPRVILQSFSTESLQRLRARNAQLPLVQLIGRGELGDDVDTAFARIASFANGVGPHHSDVDAAWVAAARRHGLVVHPYTVNEQPDLERMIALGVDGIFTDFPGRLAALRGYSVSP
jgi:glycerophosphoryl diester phosphodiesterase